MIELRTALRPIVMRLRGLVTRGTLDTATSSTKLQGAKFRGQEGEVDDAEHFEPYGFTARPFAGAEVLIVNVGADAAHPVVIAAADRRYRIAGLATGEVCLYDDQGQRVTLYRDRIEIEAPKVVVNSANVYLGGPGPALPLDGLVHGQGIDTYTGMSYAALGNASAKVAAAK